MSKAKQNINERPGGFPAWRDRKCVDCGRPPKESKFNIKGVIHQGGDLKCVDLKNFERLKKKIFKANTEA